MAYAAVLLARREKEATQKAKVSHHIPSSDQRSAERENGLRQRLGMRPLFLYPSFTHLQSKIKGVKYQPTSGVLRVLVFGFLVPI